MGILPRGEIVTKEAIATPPVVQQPRLLERIREILRLERLRSDHTLVSLVEGHLALGSIEGLRRSGVSDDELYSLVVPRRTLAHRRARREALSRDESDRAVRLARLVALAEQVFGDAGRAWRWLRASKRQFRGRSPVQLMTTEAGGRMVEELLYRIDEGLAA